MAYRFFILCVWANAFLGLSMATFLSQTRVQTKTTAVADTPASSPSIAEAPVTRKLGKHPDQHKQVKSSEVPYLSLSVQPDNHGKPVQSTSEACSPNEGSTVEPSSGQALASSETHFILINHHYHHDRSFDKSVAGGGVILGGLATVFVVSVLCYIRATGRHSGSHKGETPAAASP